MLRIKIAFRGWVMEGVPTLRTTICLNPTYDSLFALFQDSVLLLLTYRTEGFVSNSTHGSDSLWSTTFLVSTLTMVSSLPANIIQSSDGTDNHRSSNASASTASAPSPASAEQRLQWSRSRQLALQAGREPPVSRKLSYMVCKDNGSTAYELPARTGFRSEERRRNNKCCDDFLASAFEGQGGCQSRLYHGNSGR